MGDNSIYNNNNEPNAVHNGHQRTDDDKVKPFLTSKQLKELRKDRTHLFQEEATLPLIKTRDITTPLFDYEKYVDICWYNVIDRKWEGNFDIDMIPSGERQRLGVLYKNVNTILFIERKDVDKFKEIMAKAKKEIDDINKKMRTL